MFDVERVYPNFSLPKCARKAEADRTGVLLIFARRHRCEGILQPEYPYVANKSALCVCFCIFAAQTPSHRMGCINLSIVRNSVETYWPATRLMAFFGIKSVRHFE